MGIGEAEAFSERLKREVQALEAANVHAILETEPLVEEVTMLLPQTFLPVLFFGDWGFACGCGCYFGATCVVGQPDR